MNIPNWFFAGLLILLTILVFFRCRRGVSYFSGSNTFFAMNELDWIPSEIKNLLRDRINDDVVPAIKNLAQRSWANISQAEKDEILAKGNSFFTNLVTEINKASLTVTVGGSPST
jgi:hypothetical protein